MKTLKPEQGDMLRTAAFPAVINLDHNIAMSLGLTKREYFAAMAMQGIMEFMAEGYSMTNRAAARNAVECADALLVELEKPQ